MSAINHSGRFSDNKTHLSPLDKFCFKYNVNKQILKQIDNQEYNKLLNNYKDKEKIRTDIIHYVKKSAEKKFKNGFLRDSMRAYEFLTREIQIREPNLYFKAGLNAFRLKKYNQFRLGLLMPKKIFKNRNRQN